MRLDVLILRLAVLQLHAGAEAEELKRLLFAD